MKRLMDLFLSLLALILLSPFLIFISILVLFSGPGGIIYKQVRVGKDEKHFKLWKFRSMIPNADKKGQLTVGGRDPRITRIGYFLRKYKLDELPQLVNILKGDMSIIGPRPEVPKYVAMYSTDQKRVLSVRPGLSDYASLEYINENEVLEKYDDPEKGYIEEVMPKKLELNLRYIADQSVKTDLLLMWRTFVRIIS